MTKSKDSVKGSPKSATDSAINPSKDSGTMKKKASSKMQSKSDVIEKNSKKSQVSASRPKETDSKFQYSVEAAKPGDENTSLKIYFPQQFSMLENIEFLDHISDAESIIFDNFIYAVCKDVYTAEQIYRSAKGLRFQNGKNSIVCAERLGPAFCAFKSNTEDPTVLTIKKLPPGLSYQDLEIRFPKALDIALRKTMAKLKFADVHSCQYAWSCFGNIIWPKGATPILGKFPKKSDELESQESLDPNFPMFGHPKKFADDPCALHLRIKKRFELSNGMEVLDILKSATDIILSRSCTVVFSNSSDAWKRRKLLAGHSVAGGNVVAWMSRRQGSGKSQIKPAVESSEDEETEIQPPAKKMKKNKPE